MLMAVIVEAGKKHRLFFVPGLDAALAGKPSWQTPVTFLPLWPAGGQVTGAMSHQLRCLSASSGSQKLMGQTKGVARKVWGSSQARESGRVTAWGCSPELGQGGGGGL